MTQTPDPFRAGTLLSYSVERHPWPTEYFCTSQQGGPPGIFVP